MVMKALNSIETGRQWVYIMHLIFKMVLLSSLPDCWLLTGE